MDSAEEYYAIGFAYHLDVKLPILLIMKINTLKLQCNETGQKETVQRKRYNVFPLTEYTVISINGLSHPKRHIVYTQFLTIN